MQDIEYKLNKNTRIAVLCGGMSSEREVSLRSGQNCYVALLRLGYENSQLVDVDENISKVLQDGKFEVAYNALHGKYGEDGCIQGLLEMLKIPYTGCGVLSSAVCINKDCTKRMLSTSEEIPLIKSVTVDSRDDIQSKVKDLNFPLMVKPVSEGSSFGMSKVDNDYQLIGAVENAFKYGKTLLIEEYLDGICATVGVLENDDVTFATDILELRPQNEWYDYEAKYTKGMTQFILPAELSDEMTERVRDIAVKAHKMAGCSGVSRVDFLIVEDTPYVLEINTSPGMTDTSDLPAQAASMGIGYDRLVLMILNNAGLNK